MKIAITGSHGIIGTPLVSRLEESGHEVVRIVRSAKNENDIVWDPKSKTIDIEALESANVDVVIHLAGEGIAEKKWTVDQKREILESRTKGTETLVEAISKLKNKPSQFVAASAIGFYGSNADKELDEGSPAGTGFLAEVCVEWEKQSKKATEIPIPTAIIRTGIVLDKSGGVLASMLLPFKLGFGGRVGNGEQYMSWISLEDELRAILFIIENKLEGSFNLAGPEPVTNAEFTKTLGERLSRPTILPTPLLPVKLKFGSELIDALLLGSQRVYPRALQKAGFEFKHKTLKEALADVV